MQLRHIYILRVLGFVLICLRNPPALGSTPSYPSPRTIALYTVQLKESLILSN